MRRALAGLSLVICLAVSADAMAGDLPDWQQLSPEQRDVLAPLGGDWNHFDDDRRRKWLDLAERLPAMTPAEQARMRARMSYWSSLTPEERVQARERYKRLQSMPPEKREALARQWEAYEGLSREERKSLNAGQRPAGKMPGAATAAPVRK